MIAYVLYMRIRLGKVMNSLHLVLLNLIMAYSLGFDRWERK